MPTKPPLSLLFLNAPEDDELRLALQKHLSTLERDELVRVWSADEIAPGADARGEARLALDRADLIVVFVSAHLLASDHHADELDRALGRHALGQTRVFPLWARPVDWEQTPFNGLGLDPMNTIPLSTAVDLDEALARIAVKIRKALAPPPTNPRVAHRFAAPMR
jgi:hypothetical protein